MNVGWILFSPCLCLSVYALHSAPVQPSAAESIRVWVVGAAVGGGGIGPPSATPPLCGPAGTTTTTSSTTTPTSYASTISAAKGCVSPVRHAPTQLPVSQQSAHPSISGMKVMGWLGVCAGMHPHLSSSSNQLLLLLLLCRFQWVLPLPPRINTPVPSRPPPPPHRSEGNGAPPPLTSPGHYIHTNKLVGEGAEGGGICTAE